MKRGERLFVDYRKWPDAGHWHYDVFFLGEDAHGRWFHLPRGAKLQKGEEPPQAHPCTAVMLLPEDRWWIAYWNSDRSQPFEVYVDVTTPARCEAGELRTVDPDLDVVRHWTGGVTVLDEDEFALHQRTLGYPPDLVEAARRATDEAARVVAARTGPFGDAATRWLEREAG